MSPVNPDKIDTLVTEAKNSLKHLKAYAGVNSDELLGSHEKMGNIKYQFIICAEACVNLCQHISAKEFATVADSYAECFDVLVKNGVLDAEHVRQLRQLAGLRNLLVHLYWKVDNAKVIQMLIRLHEIDRYLEIIWQRYGARRNP